MNPSDIKVRPSTNADFDAIMQVETVAFGEEAEAKLTADLLNDSSAEPIISLLAWYNGNAIGHILFTRVYLNQEDSPLMHILAPLAVVPEFHKKGIGSLLIKRGLEELVKIGSELVFVLGHIDYYPRNGFINDAKKLGFEAPYPIPYEVADAWMVQELNTGALTKNTGRVSCADTLMKPEYWRE